MVAKPKFSLEMKNRMCKLNWISLEQSLPCDPPPHGFMHMLCVFRKSVEPGGSFAPQLLSGHWRYDRYCHMSVSQVSCILFILFCLHTQQCVHFKKHLLNRDLGRRLQLGKFLQIWGWGLQKAEFGKGPQQDIMRDLQAPSGGWYSQ